MEATSEKSQIFAVAAAGIQLSVKLIAFAEENGTKPDRMSSLGHDIACTAEVLRQLGEFMPARPDENTALVSESGLHATMEAAAACNAIFGKIHDGFTALVDTTVLMPGTGMSTSPVYLVHMPFWQPHIYASWNELHLRLALMVQLQTTTLASCRQASGSNSHGKDSKTEPEDSVPITGKLTEEVRSIREYRPNLIHRIWSCFPWSRSSSLNNSHGDRGILQLYLREPYTYPIENGLTVKWDTTLQAIDQRHIVEELARDERSRRTSLVKQLAHLPDSEGFEIQQWLKELRHAAVLESVVRRTTKAEHNGIKMKKMCSYRIIVRLLTVEEIDQLPIVRNFPRRRRMDADSAIREREQPAAGNGPVGKPQYLLSKRDSVGRPIFIKVHQSHMEPETLNVYRLPWVWDKHDPDYIIIKQWLPSGDQDILFEHTRLLRQRQVLGRPTYIKVHRKHLSPITLDEYGLPWEFDDRDSRYLIIKRWIDEDFQNILFEHTRRLWARQDTGYKPPQSLDGTTRSRNEPHRPAHPSVKPESDSTGGKDDIAESLLANCQSLDAAKEALEAAVRKRDAVGAGKARDAGGEEKKESVDELLGRYTTLFDAETKSPTAGNGDGHGGEVVPGEVVQGEIVPGEVMPGQVVQGEEKKTT